MLNLFPPLLFNRIRVVDVAPDFHACTVRVSRSIFTRNLQGTTFGGTIFSAADPFYAVLLWQILAHRGRAVQAWLRSGRISYRKPAATELTLEFRLTPQEVDAAIEELDRNGRFSHVYTVEARDRFGETCAIAETEVYLRLPPHDQRNLSAF